MPVANANALAENRAAAKRQAVITVSVVTFIFILWPERYIIWRNLCLVPVLAWLTSLVFDLKHGALDAWDGVPAWLKRIIGADDNSTYTNSSGSSRTGARQPQSQATAILDYVLMRLVRTAFWIKCEAVRLWEVTGPLMVEWINQAIHLLISQVSASQTSSSAGAEKPAPKFTQYYGILLKTYRGPDSPFRMRDAPNKFIPGESKDVSAVPSVFGSWDADSRLALCLVEKAIWDNRNLTLRSKIATGTYWTMTAQGRGYARPGLDNYDLGRIIAIDVIGLGDGQYDALKKCHECFRPLCQGWKYMRMHWEDVDFAVIFAFLVMGPALRTRCVQVYRALCKLRSEQAEGSRRGAPNIDPLLIAAATGGLAVPFVLPLMASGLVAAAVTKNRNGDMPEQRRKAYRSLMTRFPEVKMLFEDEEEEQREEQEYSGSSMDDDDDEWKDEGDDYYNDALSPFDW
ncbi:uncharacterized protein TRIVIDRAFT_53979 [Trichoderma virens Gv29-8]|uniref:Uncharacterized protein n=1 Tax=Hypocrea virens (strain Gv29-8 / FGSC 10586) TaxID=413071 RepID=G9MRK0_HYPVG|nr:uncharacterized protein TRIVIDRAFT_53979 [Trichoderma virens Gv29-8]EHK22721.1 hypothetical protein TRIVIDRAFT_53979 [Trichoderma virens Gv29-8]UKZ47772.1 hypothetical protein TrVGV298_002000 [Trichoderma virens]